MRGYVHTVRQTNNKQKKGVVIMTTIENEEEGRFAWEAGDRRIQAREDAWLRRQQEKGQNDD